MTTDYTDADIILTEELIRRDEKLTVEIFDASDEGDVECHAEEAPSL
jgi:hypothetical protein